MNRIRRILYWGDLAEGGTSLMRKEALRSLGHMVRSVQACPTRLSFWQRADNWLYRHGLDWAGYHSPGLNERLLRSAQGWRPDLLWIEKGVYVRAETLQALRSAYPNLKVVGYSPDHMAGRWNNSRQFRRHLPLYDLMVTTKSYDLDWFRAEGCPRTFFQGNAYDPVTHRPSRLSRAQRQSMGGPVGFIGTYEAERGGDIAWLGRSGVPVRVYGNGWGGSGPMAGVQVMGRPLLGRPYADAIGAFDINLSFLRKMNFDLQTQRSVEIPACGGFMLAERTGEHLDLFKEGKEAEFFGDRAELLDKCHFYLARPGLRAKIAAAGRQRCISSRYSYRDRLSSVLEQVQLARGSKRRPSD